MATRAELQAVLGCNNKPFINSMNEAKGHAKKTGKDIEGSFDGIADKLAGAFSVGAVLSAAATIGSFASDIKDLSDTTGQTTDSFQKFSFVVSQSGGNQQVYVKGMIAIQEKMQQAIEDTGTARAEFTKLGISMEDIKNKAPEDILLMIADATAKSGDSMANFATVIDLVGVKVATKLRPSLKLGAEGFMEIANSASIASKGAVEAAEGAQDAWDATLNTIKVGALNAFYALGEGAELMAKFEEFDKNWKPQKGEFPTAVPKEEKVDQSGTFGTVIDQAEVAAMEEREAAAAKSVMEEKAKAEQDFYSKQEALKAKANKITRDYLVSELSGQDKLALLMQERKQLATEIMKVGKASGEQEVAWAEKNVEIAKQAKENEVEAAKARLDMGEAMSVASRAGREEGLTTRSIHTGGLHQSAYGLVRRGDAARRKAEASLNKDESIGYAAAAARNTANLAKAWGVGGVERL